MGRRGFGDDQVSARRAIANEDAIARAERVVPPASVTSDAAEEDPESASNTTDVSETGDDDAGTIEFVDNSEAGTDDGTVTVVDSEGETAADDDDADTITFTDDSASSGDATIVTNDSEDESDAEDEDEDEGTITFTDDSASSDDEATIVTIDSEGETAAGSEDEESDSTASTDESASDSGTVSYPYPDPEPEQEEDEAPARTLDVFEQRFNRAPATDPDPDRRIAPDPFARTSSDTSATAEAELVMVEASIAEADGDSEESPAGVKADTGNSGASATGELTQSQQEMADELAARLGRGLPTGADRVDSELLLESEEAQSGSGTTEAPAGEDNSSADPMTGADREQQIADLRESLFGSAQATDTTNPEAREAVETFNSVSEALQSGGRPDIGGFDMSDVARPGMGGSNSGGGGFDVSAIFPASGNVTTKPAGTDDNGTYHFTIWEDVSGGGEIKVEKQIGTGTVSTYEGTTTIRTTYTDGRSESRIVYEEGQMVITRTPNDDGSTTVTVTQYNEDGEKTSESTKVEPPEGEGETETPPAGEGTEQPPDEFVDPEEAMAWRDYLNRMTGYEAAKSIPGDVDPNEHDTGESRGTIDFSRYDDLKGDNRHVEGGNQPAPDGSDLPAPGNIDGNVRFPDENNLGETGPGGEVPTNVGRNDRDLSHLDPANNADDSDGRASTDYFDAGAQTSERDESWISFKPVLLPESDNADDDADEA